MDTAHIRALRLASALKRSVTQRPDAVRVPLHKPFAAGNWRVFHETQIHLGERFIDVIDTRRPLQVCAISIDDISIGSDLGSCAHAIHGSALAPTTSARTAYETQTSTVRLDSNDELTRIRCIFIAMRDGTLACAAHERQATGGGAPHPLCGRGRRARYFSL